MEKALLELAKIMKGLCKSKEDYIATCKKNGISEKYMFLDKLYTQGD